MLHSASRQILVLLYLVRAGFAGSAQQLTEPTSKDNSAQCNCYLVSGQDPGYFQYYRFWDFRSIANDGSNNFNSPPPLITSDQNNGGQLITSSLFNTSQFQADWTMLDGQATGFSGTVVNFVDSFQNIFIGRDNDTSGTYLAMRALRLQDFVSSSELDSNQQNILHASIRSRMRVVPQLSNSNVSGAYAASSAHTNTIDGLNASHPVAPGAVVGIFTYRTDNQESDIEILTHDPITDIRYSNQPDTDKQGDPVPNASTQQAIPGGIRWTDYHEQRLDWFDGVSRWYVDDNLALEKTVNVPSKPSGFNLNVWSNGGSWSGNMTPGAQVVAAFEWIEMTFNISGNLNGKRHAESKCSVGCSIDNIKTTGQPEVSFNSSTATGSASRRKVDFTKLALATTLIVAFLGI